MGVFSIDLTRQLCVVMTLLLWSLPFHHRVNCELPTIFPSTWTIGAALSDDKMCESFQKITQQKNTELEVKAKGVTLSATCIKLNGNPIVAAEMVCDTLIPSQMYVMIASHSKAGELSPMSVSFTCGFYNIPIIGISVRESTFSDKNVHATFLRTVPPYSEQSDIWVEMLKLLEYKQIIFIHSTNQEGRAMLSRFQSKLESKDVEIQIERNIPYIAGFTNFTEILSQVKNLSSKVIVLYASVSDAEKIYNDAEKLNMTETDYVWIVTEQALKPENTPIGVLGLQLEPVEKKGTEVEQKHLFDSVSIITKAVIALVRDGNNVTEAPAMCDYDTEWEGGALIQQYLLAQRLTQEEGSTGMVQFNEVGDRMYSHYQIYNKQTEGLIAIGSGKGSDVRMDMEMIVWPGNRHIKPKGIKISTHLRVVTDPSVPFVYTVPRTGDTCDPEKVPCSRHNESDGTTEHFCCYGYCMDLLEELAVKVNFTYTLHLSPDGVYGSFDRHVERGGRTIKTWNGMIGELINGKADMIVTPLTINPERALSIDFTKPFKYQGMTILVKKTIKDSSLASFLQPFQDTLWILVGLSVHVVALVLYLLDRFSPFGRFKLAKSDDTEEDALNLSGAVWFAWGVLLNSGIGEGTPRSFSARVLGMVWAGFAMIIVASYTANLAAFLVLDRPVAAISGIDDARLRNPQENFKYATVADSAVAMYFKRQVELSTMYRTMEQRFVSNELDAIQAVKDGRLHAFIWDSSRLEFEAANDCDLVTAGELFGRSGYGIGLTKGSPWTEEISLKILSFHETGFMEQLDNTWILVSDTNCPERDASPATLGLTNMAGVFMMVAGGIVAGVFLIFIEIAYKRHRGLKEKELELAKTAADRWRGNIEKRKLLRQTRAALRKEFQMSELSNGPSEKTHVASNPPPAATGAEQGKERYDGESRPRRSPQPLQPQRSPSRLPARRYQYQV